jgi:outer membrane protein assembly factor BamA
MKCLIGRRRHPASDHIAGEGHGCASSGLRRARQRGIAYGSWSPIPKLAITGSGGWLARPTLLTSAGPFDRDEPDTTFIYSSETAASLIEQPTYLHVDGAVAWDSRDHPSYPTVGGFYRAEGGTYRERANDAYTFERFEVEAAQFVPVAKNRGVLALHWWTVLSHTGSDQAVPFYFLPGLGGHNTLRGYADYRFHDRHLMVVNAESRWALFPHVDGAVFFDAGSVAAKVRDLDFARTSAGFGFRVHTSKTTLVRFDVGRSEEGWRFLLKLTDPLRFGRLNRRTVPLPFVP